MVARSALQLSVAHEHRAAQARLGLRSNGSVARCRISTVKRTVRQRRLRSAHAPLPLVATIGSVGIYFTSEVSLLSDVSLLPRVFK